MRSADAYARLRRLCTPKTVVYTPNGRHDNATVVRSAKGYAQCRRLCAAASAVHTAKYNKFAGRRIGEKNLSSGNFAQPLRLRTTEAVAHNHFRCVQPSPVRTTASIAHNRHRCVQPSETRATATGPHIRQRFAGPLWSSATRAYAVAGNGDGFLGCDVSLNCGDPLVDSR